MITPARLIRLWLPAVLAVQFVPLSATATPYSDAVLLDNPVAYWRLGETAGPIVDEVSGRTGSLSAGNATGAAGAIVGDADTAVASGGSGGTIVVNDRTGMFSPTFSIETWVKYGSNCTDGTGSGNHCNIAGPRGQSGVYRGYGFGTLDTGATMTHLFYLNAEGSTPLQPGVTGPLVTLDQWYHVIGTYDGDTMRLYVDGLLADSRLADYVPDDANPFELFGSGYKVAENTTLDEVAYYDYALGANRVENHYLTGTAVIPEPSTALLVGFGLVGLATRRK